METNLANWWSGKAVVTVSGRGKGKAETGAAKAERLEEPQEFNPHF